jgi:hypothetical protein
MAWGGPAEQRRDREAGNLEAKDWYDEAHAFPFANAKGKDRWL